MRLGESAALDALCGEYLLGTLRGRARRRFERAIREEPRVAMRLNYWQNTFAPRRPRAMEVEPSAEVWKRLERELELARYRTPWHRRLGFWRGFAVAATASLALAIALTVLQPLGPEPATIQIAELAGKPEAARVIARSTADRRYIELQARRAYEGGPNQSYELWLLPAAGGPPISLAVLGSLDARFAVPPAQIERLRAGGKLAVSVEPAGGSPTGAPTGPVILAGSLSS
jgi:anti-sigma-K factor RskA